MSLLERPSPSYLIRTLQLAQPNSLVFLSPFNLFYPYILRPTYSILLLFYYMYTNTSILDML